MNRAPALAVLTGVLTACSSFGSDSPSPSATLDASSPSTNTDAGAEAGTDAGAKAQLVQSTQQQAASTLTSLPIITTFKTAPTPGNTVIVVVADPASPPTSVTVGQTVLDRKAETGDHIETTVWTGKVESNLPEVRASWAGGGIKNAVIFITEWSNVGELAFENDKASDVPGPPQTDAQTPNQPANGAYSLVLAVGATQDKPGPQNDAHFTAIEGSGAGVFNVYLSLAFTTDALPSYGASWSGTHTMGWDTVIVGFR